MRTETSDSRTLSKRPQGGEVRLREQEWFRENRASCFRSIHSFVDLVAQSFIHNRQGVTGLVSERQLSWAVDYDYSGISLSYEKKNSSINVFFR